VWRFGKSSRRDDNILAGISHATKVLRGEGCWVSKGVGRTEAAMESTEESDDNEFLEGWMYFM
jgi:hypothetical protein